MSRRVEFASSLVSVCVASILALALVLAGCETPTLGRGIVVRNETDVAITFEWLLEEGVVPRTTPVGPGEEAMLIGDDRLGEHSRVGEDGCTTVPIVALGPDGEQIARAEPPMCVGDEWVVQSDSE